MSDEPETAAPAVHVVEKKRKKKRKVSRELRDVEQMERHLSRAAEHAARAVAEGVDAYAERRQRSAEKKRDGALRDLPMNTAAGFAETLRGMSEVPLDLAKAMNTRSVRRAFYLGTRMLLYPLGRV